MPNYALTYPVVPGKSDADVKAIAAAFYADPAAYREARRRAGITLERAYLQKTPMGSFVVAYVESSKSIAEFTAALVGSTLPIDRKFLEHVKDIHGIDLTKPAPGPLSDTIADWSDPNVGTRRRGMAFTAPLLPGKTDAGRAFVGEAFQMRGAELAESRRALSQNREVITIQTTPQGDIANVYLEGTDPWAGNRKFAASTSPFDVWFKNELTKIFPPFVDFSKPVDGVEEIFDSEKVAARAQA